jgi:hypothetical protein
VGTELRSFEPLVAPYVSMMKGLVDGRTSAAVFAATYMDRYLADDADWPDELFLVLDRVFGMSESLQVDPKDRTNSDFDKSPEELRESVVEAIAKLDALLSG